MNEHVGTPIEPWGIFQPVMLVLRWCFGGILVDFFGGRFWRFKKRLLLGHPGRSVLAGHEAQKVNKEPRKLVLCRCVSCPKKKGQQNQLPNMVLVPPGPRTIVKYNVELNRATFYYGTLVLLPTIIITYLSFGVFFMSHEVGVSWSNRNLVDGLNGSTENARWACILVMNWDISYNF